MDDEKLIELLAIIDEKLERLEKAADQASVAAGSMLNATEELKKDGNSITESYKGLSDKLYQIKIAQKDRPYIGNWHIGGFVALLCIAITFGHIYYNKYEQADIIEGRIALEKEKLMTEARSEMNNAAKWADSQEGKSAKELYEFFKTKLNFNVATMNKDNKKAMYDYLSNHFKK